MILRNRMRATVAALALGVAGLVGLPTLFHGTPGAPGIAPAAAAGAAVTPKTEAPNEARALSRAFSNVAKALGPSVVRIEVEVARGAGRGGPHGRRPPRDQRSLRAAIREARSEFFCGFGRLTCCFAAIGATPAA